ncbi:hypothetical protein FQA39_LY16217 [Lamprigera yunnana]|nr:hypothetical protein FQA39_LY16217 [Lamprigera yunnana]
MTMFDNTWIRKDFVKHFVNRAMDIHKQVGELRLMSEFDLQWLPPSYLKHNTKSTEITEAWEKLPLDIRNNEEMKTYLLCAKHWNLPSWECYFDGPSPQNKNMEKIVTENLFLLEFSVDRVELNQKLLGEYGECDTNVSVQFLDNPYLNVCEGDLSSTCLTNLTIGKSCLFSLTPEQAEKAIEEFNINVTISKQTENGKSVPVGTCTIPVTNLFTYLIAALKARQDGNTSPMDKTLKDSFKVHNSNGEFLGVINIYVRISCFGKLIVNQFQMNMDDQSVLFKPKSGNSLYRYKKSDNNKESCKQQPQPTSAQLEPCIKCIVPPYVEEGDARYREIGCCMGGSVVTLRVHKQKKEEQNCFCNEPTPCGVSDDIPKNEKRSPFSIKVAGCGLGAQKNVEITPPVYDTDNGNRPELSNLVDPNRDVYILRINKKKVQVDNKSNLQLELCTPKVPKPTKSPEVDEKETEWDSEDAKAAAALLGIQSHMPKKKKRLRKQKIC